MVHTAFKLSEKQENVVFNLGELILGYHRDDLGQEFIDEANAFIGNLQPFHRDDLTKLLGLFNSRLLSFFLMFKITPFTKMELEDQEKYYNKWVKSRIGLFRTGATALRSLCGWSFYSLEKSWEDLDIPGKTIGREDKLPTLLQGKQPWTEDLEVDEII